MWQQADASEDGERHRRYQLDHLMQDLAVARGDTDGLV